MDFERFGRFLYLWNLRAAWQLFACLTASEVQRLWTLTIEEFHRCTQERL